ncbi:MAG: dihydrolipoamide acetyltransferase family protein, partial [Tepidisphaeraceae bacterium]
SDFEASMVANADSQNPIFYLPDLGEGLDEAELIEWTVRVGQRVEENTTLAKMETAKALVEVPSPRGGVVAMLHGKPGQAIKVGAPLVTFKDAAGAAAGNSGARKAEKAERIEPVAVEERRDAGTVVGNVSDAPATRGEGVQAAPAVRKLARDLGVDLAQVAGTGIGGRITADDVQTIAHDGNKPQPAPMPSSPASRSASPSPGATLAPLTPAPSPSTPSTPPAPRPAAGIGAVRIPFRGVRRTIAEHLRHSVSNAVHYTVMDEADVTALDMLRRKLVAASNEKISLLPFVAVAVCRVLSGRLGSKFGRLNSTVDDEKQEIVQHPMVHLGIATDTESGLMVPVIRDAQHLGVLELSRQIAQLAQSARNRQIKHTELTGSTFTLSNFGAMGGRFGTPIINYPEAGILAIGRAREGVVVRDGMLGVGKILPLSLSADHRVIDGGTAASALAKIIDLLQDPDELLPPLPPGQERA